MDAEQLKQDVRAGRIDVDRLIDLLIAQQAQIRQLSEQLQAAQRRIAELEQKLGGPTAKVEQPFSLRAEEQRQAARGKSRGKKPKRLRQGRLATADKLALAEREERVYPDGVDPDDCRFSHSRPMWRVEQGRAVLVAYHIYRGPRSQYGQIPGALGRCEFGLEVIIAIAYQIYVVGLSFDKVCMLMNFFQGLQLTKSQADALLYRLSRAWESEFGRLCGLLASSAVVHADETSWSLNSVWAFLSEKARVLWFGVHKDADTLRQILDPASFAGIVISDDAAVYANFTQSQKCWAHLLRKAIKLTLLDPANETYRELTDRLLEIYRQACRVQRDRRYGEAGRMAKVAELDDQVFELCWLVWAAELPPGEGPADDYRLLCNELMRLMLARQLFTFVTAATVETPSGQSQSVAGTNNEAERELREPAAARQTGRASKTVRGARRRTVIVSVLQSLRQYLAKFSLSRVIEEITSWSTTGKSCFARLVEELDLPPPTTSPLDQLLPQHSK